MASSCAWQVLGAGYPEGGPQEMALAMVESIEARGGAVYVRCPVESIAVDRSTGKALGVTLPGGRLIRAKRVVSGIGWRKTMAMLPPDSAPPRQPVTSQSCGFVMGNITLSGTAEELGISSANMWIQPSSEANGYNAIKVELFPLQGSRCIAPSVHLVIQRLVPLISLCTILCPSSGQSALEPKQQALIAVAARSPPLVAGYR